MVVYSGVLGFAGAWAAMLTNSGPEGLFCLTDISLTTVWGGAGYAIHQITLLVLRLFVFDMN